VCPFSRAASGSWLAKNIVFLRGGVHQTIVSGVRTRTFSGRISAGRCVPSPSLNCRTNSMETGVPSPRYGAPGSVAARASCQLTKLRL
jgi:hypothetical protein